MHIEKYEREIGRLVTAERPFVGFRIAETGADRTSMVTRRIGPAIVSAEQWDVILKLGTLERVDQHCREVGVICPLLRRWRIRGWDSHQS